GEPRAARLPAATRKRDWRAESSRRRRRGGGVTGERLLEVRCEEIPARMLEAAIKELTQRTFEDLMGRGVGPREVETGFTPRRLVMGVKGLPQRQDDQVVTEIGPPKAAAFGADGQPTPAAVGFA